MILEGFLKFLLDFGFFLIISIDYINNWFTEIIIQVLVRTFMVGILAQVLYLGGYLRGIFPE